jgi:hypothetical protein
MALSKQSPTVPKEGRIAAAAGRSHWLQRPRALLHPGHEHAQREARHT